MSINLLPEEIRVHHINRGQKSLWLVLLILYAGLFAGSNGFLFYKISAKPVDEAAWHRLQMEHQQAEETLAQLNDALDRIIEEKNALEALWQREQEQAAVVAFILEQVPTSMRLLKLQVTEEDWATLSGEASSLEEISLWVGALSRQALFREVTLAQLDVNRETGVSIFTIDLRFNREP